MNIGEDRQQLERLTAIAMELSQRHKYRKIETYFPDEGHLSWKNYPRHMEFFAAGKLYTERCALAGNRVGKTESMAGYELACHLTGIYPHWWPGRKFDHPVKTWLAGDTGQTVRDILQAKLMGPIESMGTGLIPRDNILDTKRKAGTVLDALEMAYIRHTPTGGISTVGFKSYDQKRKSFYGTEMDVIALDEEVDSGIYSECVIRTGTTNGLVMLTFTPLQGLTPVVELFLKEGLLPSREEMKERFVVNATWDDAPHLTEESKRKMLAACEPHLRKARSMGIPHLGAGSIYPVEEESLIVCEPFPIPAHWPRVYAMDVGWQRTAALWCAWDRDSDCVYLTSEHYLSHAEPPIHASAIKARGAWVPGVIDPASRGRSQLDGEKLFSLYQGEGLDLTLADNALETGIQEVWVRMVEGRLKAFSNLSNWRMERRLYHRDERGRVAENQKDHLQDCTRYLVMSGLEIAITEPTGEEPRSYSMGRTKRGRTTGY